MDRKILNETIECSISGKIKFPQIVGMLIDQGIESYHVDLIRAENRYYNASGESQVLAIPHKMPEAAEKFVATSVQASIKRSQQGVINYTSFIEEITKAGCVYYIAYLKGERVIYFGREGDFHVEHFPQK